MQLCCSFKRVQILALLVATSVIITILMILFFFNYPSIVKQRIIDEVVFKNGSEAMDRFLTTKEIKNLRLTFHMYTVTNPNEVILSKAKINLKEIGSFVYKEYKTKEILDNNQTSGLITYKLHTRYTLDLAASSGDPSKISITWPNVPLLAAQGYLENLSFFEKLAAYTIINRAIPKVGDSAFITDTVENFLFKGSKRDLFVYLQDLDKFKFISPWPLKDNRFGILYGKDKWDWHTDYIMTSSAGLGISQTYSNLNSYVYLNGSSTMPFWQNNPQSCNQIAGTDGEMFSPFLNRSQNIEVFSMNICRKLSLKYKQDYLINSIPAYKFVLDEKTFMSGKKNPDNTCFCLVKAPDGSRGLECELDGLIDLSTCNNPNVVASGAHFFSGSPSLLSRISGVSPPNASLHEPVIYLEPNTGLSVKVKVPLQFNIRLVKNKFKIFNFFQDDNPLIIPLLWVEEEAELTDDQASLLRSKLLLLDSWFVSMVLGGSIIFVLAISVIATILCVRYRDSRLATEASETDPLIPPNSAASETRSYTNSIRDD